MPRFVPILLLVQLLEASGFCEESDSTRVGDLLSDLMDRSLVMDGTIAQVRD